MFDWSDIAFGSKKPLDTLHATFIVAPRELSTARFTQLVKQHLPHGNILLGLAKEPFVEGFEDQPQFRTLRAATVQPIIDKVNRSTSKHRIYTLTYFQREAPYILEKLRLRRIVLINGSWYRSFHTRPEYYTIVNRNIAYEMVTPFSSETEAQQYAQDFERATDHSLPTGTFSATQMMHTAAEARKDSFDYAFQTGAALGKKTTKGYRLLATSFNKVVPYQTYALHYGASRETHFSPPHDLNHYDTIHAEVAMIIKAAQQGIDLRGTALFINLLPCPACARMFSQTDIAHFAYSQDHSDGYALKMLTLAGKTIERIVQ